MNQSVGHLACGAEAGLISIDQALALIFKNVQSLGTETVALSDALNHFLAEAVYSSLNLPMFSQSAVDGYAICATGDVHAHTEFELVGELRAGQLANISLREGQAVRIFTGAAIPQHTTTVARQEIVQAYADKIVLSHDLATHTDIRDIGEEIAQGQRLAEHGQQLSVGAIAALSMAGVRHVQVYRYPKVAVVITGDEIAMEASDLATGKIFDANAPLIQAWFKARNQKVSIFHVADDEGAVSALFDQLKNQYDLIITTGGVSVGDYDFVRPVALKVGFEQIFWKIKQKPGKPMFFAQYTERNLHHCYLLGLPGNPAAVYVGMQIYASTLLNALQNQQQQPNWFSGQMTHALKPDARERFLRMSVQFEQGILRLSNLTKQQSHMLSNLMHANCLVRVPANQSIQIGQCLNGIFI
ncbi:molybdopterin molybdenumtransferase MoeA [Acinetobacter cumulans]|uniref:Molybdopterin molybdenumtransferase n=1 Tax=Acinetobacter cumulans TaxID=2136182 RepID=A0ABX9UA80_9GAMM|nr:molybdopterin molybdotransferase MoeA [Acinetobacter cumulans]RLL49904.1 molybdopterin molybdenumtransferase MoeA [Acinetobacter cumulans]